MRKYLLKATTKKVLSCLLVASFVVSMFAGIPKEVSAADVNLHDENGVPNMAAFEKNDYGSVTWNYKIEETAKGIKNTAPAGTEACVLRTEEVTVGTVSFQHGLRMEFSDFSATKTDGSGVSENYGIRVCLGNNKVTTIAPTAAPSWGGSDSGYFVWYNADGNVAIYQKKYSEASNKNLTYVCSEQFDSLATLKNKGKSFVLEVKPIATGKKNGTYEIYDWNVYINGNWMTTLEGVNSTTGALMSSQGYSVRGVSVQVLPDITTLFGESGNENRNGFGDNFTMDSKTYWSTNKIETLKKDCTVTYTLSKFQIAETPVSEVSADDFERTGWNAITTGSAQTQIAKGVQVIAPAKTEAYMLRTKPGSNPKVSFPNGLRMEFSDFSAIRTAGTGNSENYGIRVCLGNKGNANDKYGLYAAPDFGGTNRGYYIWYNADGWVAIYKKTYESSTDNNLKYICSEKFESLAELKRNGKAFTLEVKPIQTDITHTSESGYKNYNWKVYINGRLMTTLEHVNDIARGGVFQYYQRDYIAGVSMQVLPGIATLFGTTGNESRNGFGDDFAMGTYTYRSDCTTASIKDCDVTYTLSKFQILDETQSKQSAMLKVNVQTGTQGETNYLRVLATVDSELTNYKEAGIILSQNNREYAANEDKIACVNTGTPIKTVYRNISTDEGNVTPSGSGLYDENSVYFFGRVFKGYPTSGEAYVRAYVQLMDGTYVYGDVTKIDFAKLLTPVTE